MDRLRPHGQEHLVAFWDCLDESQRRWLAAEIRGVDLALVTRLYRDPGRPDAMRDLADRASSPPAIRLGDRQKPFPPEAARRRGEEALRAGKVGAILVAGGQGTRLGFEHPKGMFPIGPVSNKSLFQLHVEKLLAAARRHGVRIPLYLMTSPATHDETVEYFAAHRRFGLPEDDLRVFCQGTMPAVDAATGRILLSAR
ncbi:MAG: UTP--glucose-1-phosphate uridylyltransferase [Thermoguttaceae bacterium]|nr:UTP--glucose-1-phosphate uridylyltransferase [Thermoguttaceae bacterium]